MFQYKIRLEIFLKICMNVRHKILKESFQTIYQKSMNISVNYRTIEIKLFRHSMKKARSTNLLIEIAKKHIQICWIWQKCHNLSQYITIIWLAFVCVCVWNVWFLCVPSFGFQFQIDINVCVAFIISKLSQCAVCLAMPIAYIYRW